jgi:hypothetical protein
VPSSTLSRTASRGGPEGNPRGKCVVDGDGDDDGGDGDDDDKSNESVAKLIVRKVHRPAKVNIAALPPMLMRSYLHIHR